MTCTEWVAKYKPIDNPHDDNASWDSKIYEAYGAEQNVIFSGITSEVSTIRKSCSVFTRRRAYAEV